MNWKLSASLLTALACSAFAATGCSAASSEDETTSDQEVSAAPRLGGAFHLASGALPRFDGLVLNPDGTFFADVDTGIRCITAPCPSFIRLSGSYVSGSSTSGTLWLRAAEGAEHSSYYGEYGFALAGESLTLTRKDGFSPGWKNELSSAPSYCAQADDCYGQDIIHPMCLGGFTCGGAGSTKSANQCSWQCGDILPPTNEIFPADAAKVVAHTAGGGFTPPPPPGSNCGLGAATYTLDVATSKVAYETCTFVDWDTPLTSEKGEATLDAAQLAKVTAAMKALTIAKNEICGADKPFLTVSVTSPSQGTKKYDDSFYSCIGEGTYVEGIDGVFSAFRDVTGH